MPGPETKPSTPKKLTAEQRKRVAAWIEEHTKGKGKGCPVCGHPDWQLAEDIVEIQPHYENKVFPDVVYPHVMLMCRNCAYVMLFHATVIGVMEKEPRPTKDGN